MSDDDLNEDSDYEEEQIEKPPVLSKKAPSQLLTAQMQQRAQREGNRKGRVAGIKQRITEQSAFKDMAKLAFKEVDINGNGRVDAVEFYAGVLLLYHKVNAIPWGGRKKPPKRKDVLLMYSTYIEKQKAEGKDMDELDYESFERICANHFDQFIESIVWRIFAITIFFPLIAVYMTSFILSIKGVEEALGSYQSFVPTIIISGLVTALPYFEKFLAQQMTQEQRRGIRDIQRTVEVGVKRIASRGNAGLSQLEEVLEGTKDKGLKAMKNLEKLVNSRRRVKRR